MSWHVTLRQHILLPAMAPESLLLPVGLSLFCAVVSSVLAAYVLLVGVSGADVTVPAGHLVLAAVCVISHRRSWSCGTVRFPLPTPPNPFH
jgi:hypothetical protein